MAIVSVWLNAFIPRDVPNYTIRLSTGAHVGKTAIPLPGIARTWPGNWLKDWDAGYLTDQRSFSDAPDASVRMQSRAEIEVAGLNPRLVSETHRTSGTTEVNTTTGVQTGFDRANMSRCFFTPWNPPIWRGPPPTLPMPQQPYGPLLGAQPPPPILAVLGRIGLHGSAGDPLVGMAADIDYYGHFNFVLGASVNDLTVEFDGVIDSFPAFEAYARYNGVTKMLFQADPPPGNTVTDLLGDADTPITGRCAFP